jgi:5,10-methylenetetrahydrofolate reductase
MQKDSAPKKHISNACTWCRNRKVKVRPRHHSLCKVLSDSETRRPTPHMRRRRRRRRRRIQN